MGLNAYDDAQEALAAGTPRPSATPADPVYTEAATALRGMDATRTQDLRRSWHQAADTTPDQAAEFRRLSLRFGVPAAAIARDPAKWRQAGADDQPFGAIATETPHTAAWLTADPTHAALAKDDLSTLGGLEWLVTAPGRAFAQARDQATVATLTYQQMFRPLTQAEHDQLESARYQAERGGDLGATRWF